MKTVEERAKEYVERHRSVEACYFTPAGSYSYYAEKIAYEVGAAEQKAIDDAILLKLKSAWEKEAQINHDDEANRKQGYHDASEKFCEWLRSNWRKYVYRDRDGGILFGHWESDFRKAMEEEPCQR